MAVVSSGQIRLNADVNVEINGSIGTNVSLSSLSTGASKSAPHGLFEFYGYTSADPPQSDVNNITNLTSSSMQVNCYIQNNGGAPITSYGIYFGTNSNCTSNTKYTVGTGNTVYWNKNFTGLSANTTYYMQSWAANSAGEQLGQRCVAVATLQPLVPYTAVAGYSYVTFPDTAGAYTCGYPGNFYGPWGRGPQTILSGTNTIGTTVYIYGFISMCCGFNTNSAYWSGGTNAGTTRSGSFVYISNGYNCPPQTYDANSTSSSSDVVPCSTYGYVYYQTGASGYQARNVLAHTQPFIP